MLWQVLFACLIVWYACSLWNRRRLFQLAKKLKNDIKSFPIIGHAYLFLGAGKAQMETLQLLGREAIKHGGVTYAWLGTKLYIVAADIDVIDVVLKNCLEKEEILKKCGRVVMDNGFLIALVPLWRPRRKIMLPLFNLKNLRQFVEKFSNQSDILVAQLKHAPKDTFPIWDHLVSYAMHSVSGDKNEIKSILDELLAAKEYSYSELLEELRMLLIASVDTSAVSTSFTVLLLSRHPDIQENVYHVVLEVIGDTDRPIVAEDLPKLKYLDAVIKESLRLFPPVPLIGRTVDKDITLPSGVTLVKGCNVNTLIWAVHRNPKYWGPDPDEFRPERFFSPYDPKTFMAFSYGPRNCVGYKYAMMSMTTMLATLVRHFRILPALVRGPDGEMVHKPIITSFDITMKDVDNFPVRLEPRV